MPGSTQVLSSLFPVFAYGTVTLSGRLSHTFLLTFLMLFAEPYNPQQLAAGFGLFPFRSPLLRE